MNKCTETIVFGLKEKPHKLLTSSRLKFCDDFNLVSTIMVQDYKDTLHRLFYSQTDSVVLRYQSRKRNV